MARAAVLLPVYNAERYIEETIHSVLCQTFTDFILYAINDGSTDGSLNLLKKIKDPRICIIEKPENTGLTDTLNTGLQVIKEEFILRMDADDVANPNRFERQITFMDAHPEVIVCGTQVNYIGNLSGKSSYPLTDSEIKATMIFQNPMAHPTVIIRSRILQSNSLLYQKGSHLEDYGLWLNLMPLGKFANLAEPLLNYRIEGQNISLSNLSTRAERVKIIYNELPVIGEKLKNNSEEMELHLELAGHKPVRSVIQIFKYCGRLQHNLKISGIFEPGVVSNVIRKYRNQLFFSLADRSKFKPVLFWLVRGSIKWVELKYYVSKFFTRPKK